MSKNIFLIFVTLYHNVRSGSAYMCHEMRICRYWNWNFSQSFRSQWNALKFPLLNSNERLFCAVNISRPRDCTVALLFRYPPVQAIVSVAMVKDKYFLPISIFPSFRVRPNHYLLTKCVIFVQIWKEGFEHSFAQLKQLIYSYFIWTLLLMAGGTPPFPCF